MKAAAAGFRPHSGWTSLVVVSLERGSPVVLLRERVHLVKTFNYSYRQPYHTAAKAGLEEGRAFISQVRNEAQQLAGGAFRRVQAKLACADYCLTHCGLLLGSGRVLPSLEKILSSHALIHTADGELFRQALIHAGQRCNLVVFTGEERELFATACKSLGMKTDSLAAVLIAIGKPIGAPWSQGEKLAALSAWLALTRR